MKQCVKCGKVLPETTEYFHPSIWHKGGLHTNCKECIRARKRAYYHTSKGKAVSRECLARYKQSDKYKQRRKEFKERNQSALEKKLQNNT